MSIWVSNCRYGSRFDRGLLLIWVLISIWFLLIWVLILIWFSCQYGTWSFDMGLDRLIDLRYDTCLIDMKLDFDVGLFAI